MLKLKLTGFYKEDICRVEVSAYNRSGRAVQNVEMKGSDCNSYLLTSSLGAKTQKKASGQLTVLDRLSVENLPVKVYSCSSTTVAAAWDFAHSRSTIYSQLR